MRKLIFLIGVLMCVGFVSSLEISASSDTDVIIKDLDSSVKLTLEITDAPLGDYNVYTLSDIQIIPSDIFKINSGSITKTFTLKAYDNLNISGYYTFTYTLNERGVEKFDEKFNVKLLNLGDVVDVSVENIDFDSNEADLVVENKENVDIGEVFARFDSILFTAEESFELGPKEKKVFRIVVDGYKLKRTKAGVYVITSKFNVGGKEVPVNGNLYLGEKKGISVTEDYSGILIKTHTINKVNTGNVFESVEIYEYKNIFSRLFTSFNVEPTLVERDGFSIKYTWVDEKLGPAEVFTIKTKTNYLLPFFIVVIAFVAFFGFRKYARARLILKKSVRYVKTKGGEFALKVTISLKATRAAANVTVIDRVPAIVKIYKKFGTIKPDKIDPHSRRVHWNLGDLNAGEERVFNYIIYSKVGVVGKFVLPEALAVFEEEDKIHEISSNKVFFMSDQIRGD